MKDKNQERGFIAVAIQYRDDSQIKSDIINAQKLGAEIIEIRFDYNKGLKSYLQSHASAELVDIKSKIFTQNQIEDILSALQIPVIFTLRKQAHGGNIKIAENLRIEIIQYLISYKPDFVDIEVDTNQAVIKEIQRLSNRVGCRIIFSYHDWKKTPATGQIIKIIKDLKTQISSLATKESQNVVKLIFTAQNMSDNYKIIEILNKYRAEGLNIICFCMGHLGVPSRVSSILFGGYLSFASITDGTAPGQVSIQQFKELLEKARDNQKSK